MNRSQEEAEEARAEDLAEARQERRDELWVERGERWAEKVVYGE